ncbi:hypothetical protein DIPPA_05109 [Diplonema papillatum]|nr:hypothetical protein DIPPA_05109 [Diplonema papillatum]|eukprot:gene16020-24526_t
MDMVQQIRDAGEFVHNPEDSIKCDEWMYEVGGGGLENAELTRADRSGSGGRRRGKIRRLSMNSVLRVSTATAGSGDAKSVSRSSSASSTTPRLAAVASRHDCSRRPLSIPSTPTISEVSNKTKAASYSPSHHHHDPPKPFLPPCGSIGRFSLPEAFAADAAHYTPTGDEPSELYAVASTPPPPAAEETERCCGVLLSRRAYYYCLVVCGCVVCLSVCCLAAIMVVVT